jgi:hypothetical protein
MVDFILEPPQNVTVDDATESGMVIFCVDISGSMCLTTQVPALQGITKRLFNIVCMSSFASDCVYS